MLDEKTIQKLIEIASKSAEPDAVEGVLAVQQLMQDNKDLKASLETLKADSEKEKAGLQAELDKATRTMARLIAQNGCMQEEEEQDEKQDLHSLAKKLFG